MIKFCTFLDANRLTNYWLLKFRHFIPDMAKFKNISRFLVEIPTIYVLIGLIHFYFLFQNCNIRSQGFF